MRIPPILKESYEVHWGNVFDFRGKVILDVGADIGSTADYFLECGATKVICIESDKNYCELLEVNAKKIPEIIPIHLFVSNSQHYFAMLEAFQPNLVKVDCEGCERFLIDVPCETLRIASEWMIETHDDKLHEAIITKFKNCGFVVVKDFLFCSPSIWVTFFRSENNASKLNEASK